MSKFLRNPLAVSLVIITGTAVYASSGKAPVVTIDEVTCAPAKGNARVSATVKDAAVARVLVKTSADAAEYAVEMRADKSAKDRYWAVLPVPADGITSLEVRVAAKGSNGEQVASESRSVPVQPTGCAVTLTADQQKAAQNLTLGATVANQGAAKGFAPNGIVAQTSSKGEMRPYDGSVPSAFRAGGAEPVSVKTGPQRGLGGYDTPTPTVTVTPTPESGRPGKTKG